MFRQVKTSKWNIPSITSKSLIGNKGTYSDLICLSTDWENVLYWIVIKLYCIIFSHLRPSLFVADEFLVLEVNHQTVSMRHGDHHAPSIWRPHDLLIRDLLLLFEEASIDVQEDTDDRGWKIVQLHLKWSVRCSSFVDSRDHLAVSFLDFSINKPWVPQYLPVNFSENVHKHLCIFIDVAPPTAGNICEGVVEVDMAFEIHITCFSFLLRPVLVESGELQESHKTTVVMLMLNLGWKKERKFYPGENGGCYIAIEIFYFAKIPPNRSCFPWIFRISEREVMKLNCTIQDGWGKSSGQPCFCTYCMSG